MKRKHILKWLGIALGVYLLYGVLTAILVPLHIVCRLCQLVGKVRRDGL